LILLLAACTAQEGTRPLEPLRIPLAENTNVVVEIESGMLLVTQGETGQLELSSEQPVPERTEVTTASEADGLHIRVRGQGDAPLSLRIPEGTNLRVATFDAQVSLLDLDATLRVDSTAGDILAENVSGSFTLISNRGDITVRSGRGELRVLGNYGLLSLQDVAGVMRASTIMGTIQYTGRVAAEDRVQLETDHGPVIIRLDMNSDAAVQVSTTSGVSDCVVPGLAPDGAGCTGQLGNGSGQLNVRTVSGSVDLQRIP
jgi:hypothetical protein